MGRYRTAVVLALALAACRRGPGPEGDGEVHQQGVASWYGERFHGRKTASGEVFDMNRRTAAHRTLPFRTRLRVRDSSTGRACEVVVTDRGPFVKDRIIDLSRAAGQDLDLMQRGTTEVRLYVLERPPTRAQYFYAVQVGMPADRAAAEGLRAEMEGLSGSARLQPQDTDEGIRWRVLAGREDSPEAAQALLERLRAGENGFVVMLDEE